MVVVFFTGFFATGVLAGAFFATGVDFLAGAVFLIGVTFAMDLPFSKLVYVIHNKKYNHGKIKKANKKMRGRPLKGASYRKQISIRIEEKIMLKIKGDYGSVQKFIDRKIEEETRKRNPGGNIKWA